MILTELYRTNPDSSFEESDLFIAYHSIHSARIERDSREYYGTTEVTAEQGDDHVYFYVKESPAQIAKIIQDEERSEFEDDD